MDAMTLSTAIGLVAGFGMVSMGAYELYRRIQTRRLLQQRLRVFASR